MSTNFQKTPIVENLAKLSRAAADDSTWMQGKSFPCIVDAVVSPGIVTVDFQMENSTFTLHNITMPVAKPPYMQYPVKKGDKGVAMSADVVLAAMSGLGGGTPNPQSPTGNLSALYFVWLGNVDEEFLDSEAVTVYSNLVCTPTELAFFGGSKVVKQTLAPVATDLGSAITLVNSIRAAMIAYGLAE